MAAVSRSTAPFRQARRAGSAIAFFYRQLLVRLDSEPEPHRARRSARIRAGNGSRVSSVLGPVGASPERARAFPV
jgi:hypothetical protein